MTDIEVTRRIMNNLLAATMPAVVVNDRLHVLGKDAQEPIEILLASIAAEPHRAAELCDQVVERVVLWLDESEYQRRYMPARASA